MARLSVFQPDSTKSSVDRLRQEQEAEQNQEPLVSRLFDAGRAAFAENNTLPLLYQGALDAIAGVSRPEPGFRPSKDAELWKQLIQDVPENQWDKLDEAVNRRQAFLFRERLLARQENLKALGDVHPAAAIGLSLGASLGDPVDLFVSMASLGISTPLIVGRKYQRALRAGKSIEEARRISQQTTRLGRAAQGAAVAGLANTVTEGVLIANQSEREYYEMLYAAGAGIILGGGLSAIGKNTQVGRDIQDRAELSAIMGETVDPVELQRALPHHPILQITQQGDGPPLLEWKPMMSGPVDRSPNEAPAWFQPLKESVPPQRQPDSVDLRLLPGPKQLDQLPPPKPENLTPNTIRELQANKLRKDMEHQDYVKRLFDDMAAEGQEAIQKRLKSYYLDDFTPKQLAEALSDIDISIRGGDEVSLTERLFYNQFANDPGVKKFLDINAKKWVDGADLDEIEEDILEGFLEGELVPTKFHDNFARVYEDAVSPEDMPDLENILSVFGERSARVEEPAGGRDLFAPPVGEVETPLPVRPDPIASRRRFPERIVLLESQADGSGKLGDFLNDKMVVLLPETDGVLYKSTKPEAPDTRAADWRSGRSGAGTPPPKADPRFTREEPGKVDPTERDLSPPPEVPEQFRREDVRPPEPKPEPDEVAVKPELDQGGESVDLPKSGGAAAFVHNPQEAANNKFLDAFAENIPLAFGGVLNRLNIGGFHASSPNALVRKTFGRLSQVGSGIKNAVTGETMTEIKDRLNRMWTARSARTFQTGFEQWIDSQDLGPLAKWSAQLRYQFSREVKRALLRAPGMYTDNPHINRVADEYRSLHADILKAAKNTARYEGDTLAKPLPGFEGVEPNETYLMRQLDTDKFRAAKADLGVGAVQELFIKAYAAKHPTAKLEDIREVVLKYTDIQTRISDGSSVNFNRAFTGEDIEDLRVLLTQYGESPSSVDNIVAAMERIKKDAGTIARGKWRLDFDETFVGKVYDRDGNLREVSVEDFFVDDAEYLFHSYSNQMSGAIAGAQMGFGSRIDFEKAISEIRQSLDLAIRKSPGYTEKRMELEIEAAEAVWKHVMGEPLFDHTKNGARIARIIKNWNFARMMGQVGVAQLADAGRILGDTSWKAMATHFPALVKLRRDALTGKLSDPLLDELELFYGFGTDSLHNQFRVRRGAIHDDLHSGVDYGAGNPKGLSDRIITKADEGTDKLRKIVTDVSGLAYLNGNLQRLATAAQIQHLANAAFGTGKALSRKRMELLGISEDMQERIFQQLRKHAQVDEGRARKVRRVNFESWDDTEALSVFHTAVSRSTRQMIQDTDPGNLPVSMLTSPTVQLLTQFRTFPLVAFSKQLLQGAHMRDMRVLTGFLTSVGIAAAGYIGQTYVQSIGRPDREEFLERRLDLSRIMTAAIARTPHASVLPSLVDLAALPSGSGVFSHSRTTGLSMNPLMGSPVGDLTQSVLDAFRDLGDLSDGISESTWRNFMRLLPLQNVFGIQNLLNALGGAVTR